MKLLRGKTPYVIALSLVIILSVLFFSIRQKGFTDPARNLVFDTYQQIKPRTVNDSAVVILDVDEASIDEIGQWPWSRSQMALLTEKLAQAGAIAIAFDLVFAEPDRTNPALIAQNLPVDLQDRELITSVLTALPDTDQLFAAAMARSPVVLGFFDLGAENSEDLRKIAGISWLGADLSDILHPVSGSVGSMPAFQQAATGHASISLGATQQDDIIRTIGLFSTSNGEVFPSLSIEALRVAIQNATGALQSFIIRTSQSGAETRSGRAITAARVANFEFPLTERGGFNIYYAPNRYSQYLPAKDVFKGDLQAISESVAGKIVLIGTSAPGLRDIRTTTLREAVPGVAVHAQIIDQIMEGKFLNRPDWAPGAEAVLAILLTITIIVVLPYGGAVTSAVFGALCAAVVVLISWTAFDRYGILFDPSVPLLTALAAYGMTTILLFAFAEKDKRFVRSAFQQYLAPELLTKLEADPGALKLGGEIRDMTLIFLDVRNFTAISEKLDPQELVAFLNDLLSPLSDIIQKHEGAIDKYIGDSIMAFWNAPLDVENHPEKACLAALEMLEKVDEMNARDAFGFAKRGLGTVGIGIGINSGDGCVGNMGSVSRFDYSVVGDTVNIAARLESETKAAKWPILLSAETAERTSNLAILRAGKLALKGKSEAQEVFALVGNSEMGATKSFKELRAVHDELVALSGTLATNAARKRKSNGKKLDELLEFCLERAPARLHDFISRV